MIFSQKESIYMRLAIAAPQMVSFCVQINGCEILCIIFLAPTDIFSVSLKRRTNNRTALFPKCYIHNVSYIYTLLFSSKIYNFLLPHRTVYNATKMWAVGIKQTRMHRFGGGGGKVICHLLRSSSRYSSSKTQGEESTTAFSARRFRRFRFDVQSTGNRATLSSLAF